jgi:hypothetical protein
MQSQLIVKLRKHDNLFIIIILTIHLFRLVLAYEVLKGSTCISQTSSWNVQVLWNRINLYYPSGGHNLKSTIKL